MQSMLSRAVSVRACVALSTMLAMITVARPAAMAANTEGRPTVSGPSGSPAAAPGSAVRPVTSCATLSNADLSSLDARVTSAAPVTRDGHAFCDVRGYISPVT